MSQWKIILSGITLSLFLGVFLYIYILRSNLKEVEAENAQMQVQSQLQTTYISKVEKSREENAKLVEDLMAKVNEIPDNPRCSAPPSFSNVLSGLQ